mgnify:CR=1 FL=1
MPVAAVTYDFLSPGRVAAGGATARVHAALREAIVQLDLKPGEFLDQQAIAARMGVSRFPVGEAMNRLAAEGLPTRVLAGPGAMSEIAAHPEVDMVMAAIVGAAGPDRKSVV